MTDEFSLFSFFLAFFLPCISLRRDHFGMSRFPTAVVSMPAWELPCPRGGI